MKKILIVTSQYRVGERMYPVIPYLAEDYKLDLLKVYQMLPSHKWVGTLDMRSIFYEQYLKFFQNVYQDYTDPKEYDLILTDDNRLTDKTGIYKLYRNKKENTPILSCTHGNGGFKNISKGHNLVFDKCLTFGKYDTVHKSCIPVGIPSNDKLIEYSGNKRKHILIIVNFLGNRESPYRVKFDSKIFNNIKIKQLQDYYKVPLVIKLKSRSDEGGFHHNFEYIKSIMSSELDYKIVVDVEDDNKLVAESACVISSLSTLSLKAIQLGIPTILIRDSGVVGSLEHYDGIFNITENFLDYIYSYSRRVEYIQNTVEGGLAFESTKLFLKTIKNYI